MSSFENETFITHLEALRGMLLNSITLIALLSPVGFWAAPKFIDFLIKNSLPENMPQLHYFSPMDVFLIQIKIGVLLAFILAYPYIVYEVIKFVKPALYKHESKFMISLIVSASLLFILGGVFCIYTILPLIMNFSAGFSTEYIAPTIGLSQFVTLALGLILAFGVMFEIPLVVILCVKFGLVEVSSLKHLRPYIIVAILIAAGILTPPDIISQLMLAVPTYFLFEAGILIAQKFSVKTEGIIYD